MNRYLRPWVRILPSAEEDNLSPFDSNIACLCQSIEINNNKHVYRQSQVRMPNGCGVNGLNARWSGTGCRVQVFLAWSSIAQSVCQWAFSLLAIWCLRPSAEEDNLSPFDSNIACLCQSIEINNNKHVCMKLTPCAFQAGCQLSSAATGTSLELRFFGAISVAWSVRAGQLAAGGVASVWRSWVRSPSGPR